MNRRTGQGALGLALALGMFMTAPEAEAGGRGDYWDPRASIPARIIDTHLGVIGLAATIAGDYRTAAVVDHISGRYPAPVVVERVYAPPVVEHIYYPPPVVEHVYYAPPPVVVHHVHASGCGHRGYGHGHGRHRGWGRHGHGHHHHDRWGDD